MSNPFCLQKIVRIIASGVVIHGVLFCSAASVPAGESMETTATLLGFGILHWVGMIVVPCVVVFSVFMVLNRRLLREKMRFKEYIDAAQVMLLSLDSEGRIVLINRAGAALLGGDLGAILGKNWFDTFIPEGERQRLKGVFFDLMRTGGEFSEFQENTVVRLDGQERLFAWRNTVLLDGHGKNFHTLSSGEDITERRAMERELFEKQESLAFAQKIAKLGNWDWHIKDNTLLWSDEVYGIFELEPGTFGASYVNYFDRIHPDDRQKVGQAVNEALKGGEYSLEYRVVVSDDRIKTVHAEGTVEFDSSGEPVRMIGTMQDISELVAVQEELRENEQMQRLILQSIQAAVFILDMEKGSVVEINQWGARLLDLPREAVIGQAFSKLARWYDLRGVDMDLADGEHFISSTDIQLQRADGVVLPVLVTIFPAHIRGVRRLLVIAFDNSDRKKMEQELFHARKMEAMGQLAAGVAHEINTPAQFVRSNLQFLIESFDALLAVYGRVKTVTENERAVQGSLAMLDELKGAVDELDLEFIADETPKALNESLEGLDRITAIVQGMKRFAHPGRSGQMQRVNLNQLVADAVLIAGSEWKYVAEVVTEYGEGVDSVPCLSGDLNQVVLNLLVNAAQAIQDKVGSGGQKGVITIQTRRTETDVEIIISDTGVGIPEHAREKVFDLFYSTKEVGRGTGQGLAIAYSIVVDQCGGDLSFESREGVGSTFIVSLPFEAAPHSAYN